MTCAHRSLSVVILAVLVPFMSVASQPLETETARLLPGGRFETIANFEYQTSSEGTEVAVPLELIYGVTNDLELLVEPVPYTAIRPKVGRRPSGLGDLETTVTYRFLQETSVSPAMAVAGEVKLPVAGDTLIGTGKTDFTAYLIASKQFSDVDVHANIGYAILGNPTGVQLNNLVSGALAVEYHLAPLFDIVGEVFASTSALSETADNGGTTNERSTAPEIGGGEVFGTIGGRYHVRPNLVLALGVSYDNQSAVLIRPGIGLKF